MCVIKGPHKDGKPLQHTGGVFQPGNGPRYYPPNPTPQPQSDQSIYISGLTMHSVLITNPDGKILLSRYFETSFRLQHNDDAAALDIDAENAAGLDRPLSGGSSGGGGMSMMRDRAQAMKLSESEVLGQTRHLWIKGTVECPQVARAKACW